MTTMLLLVIRSEVLKLFIVDLKVVCPRLEKACMLRTVYRRENYFRAKSMKYIHPSIRTYVTRNKNFLLFRALPAFDSRLTSERVASIKTMVWTTKSEAPLGLP